MNAISPSQQVGQRVNKIFMVITSAKQDTVNI